MHCFPLPACSPHYMCPSLSQQLPSRSVACLAAPPSFDNAPPKRKKQAYFKGAAAERRARNTRPQHSQPLQPIQTSQSAALSAGTESLARPPKHRYYMVNKPKVQGSTVVDLLLGWIKEGLHGQQQEHARQLFPATPLDVASHGLVLLSDDPSWSRSLAAAHLIREYVVLVGQAVHAKHLDTLLAGAVIDGQHEAPLQVSALEGGTKLRVVVQDKQELPDTTPALSASRAGTSGAQGAEQTAGSTRAGAAARTASLKRACVSTLPHKVLRRAVAAHSQQLLAAENMQAATQPFEASTQLLPAATQLPCINSSAFIVRESRATVPSATAPEARSDASRSMDCLHLSEAAGAVLPDAWLWNVVPWSRRCAQAALERDVRRTAPPTYQDGRPKRRKRLEPKKLQDKGFVPAPSAPSVFTAEEWRALGRGGQAGGVWQARWNDVGAGGREAGADEADQEGLCESDHTNKLVLPRDTSLACSTAAGGTWSNSICLGAGNPAAPGNLAQGSTIVSDLLRRQCTDPGSSIRHRWRRGSTDNTSRGEDNNDQDATAGRMLRQLEAPDLVCRDDWDWKVRLLVLCAGLEVLSVKRVRVGGLRVPTSLPLGGCRRLTVSDLRAITDPELQDAWLLRSRQWDPSSASIVKELSESSRRPSQGIAPRRGTGAGQGQEQGREGRRQCERERLAPFIREVVH